MLPLSLDVLSSLLFLLLADNGGLGHGGFSLAEISRRFSWLGPRWCPHAALSLRTLHWSERSRGPTLTVTRPGPVKSILSLRHFSPSQPWSGHKYSLSPPNVVSLSSPLLSSAKCLTFPDHLTSSFTWMHCKVALKNWHKMKYLSFSLSIFCVRKLEDYHDTLLRTRVLPTKCSCTLLLDNNTKHRRLRTRPAYPF